MTGMEAWSIVAPMLMQVLLMREKTNMAKVDADMVQDCYLTVFRALKQLDEVKCNDGKVRF